MWTNVVTAMIRSQARRPASQPVHNLIQMYAKPDTNTKAATLLEGQSQVTSTPLGAKMHSSAAATAIASSQLSVGRLLFCNHLIHAGA